MIQLPPDSPSQRPPHGRLDFISPRLTPRIERARSQALTDRVRKLRVVLPTAAGIIVLALFIFPALRPSFNLRDLTKNVPDLVIDNLHYTGIDDKNQPYAIQAARATKPGNMSGIYDMVKPEGDITLRSGAWIDGKADLGRYDVDGKRLWLGGNVHFFHDKGYEFVSDEAQINIANNEAWGDKPVLIKGNFGTVRGGGFRLLDGGETLIVTGPATALLSLQHHAVSDTSGAASLP